MEPLLSAADQTPDAHRPDVEVRLHLGRPTVFVDGQPTALSGFNTFGRPAFERSMAMAYGHRFQVYFISPETPRAWPETRFWVGDEVSAQPLPLVDGEPFDLDEQARHVLAGDPEAYLMVRFGVDPPHSWTERHADQLFVSANGTPGQVPSLASATFADQAEAVSAAVVAYCESRPWAHRVLGYANFGVREGTHAPLCEGYLYDYGPAMLARWRQFLHARYTTDEALQQAYGDPHLTRAEAPVPRDPLRGPVPEVQQMPYWQGAATNQPLRDYLELQRELFLSFLRRLGAAMRGAAPRRVLCLHDALKQTMLGWSNWGFFDYPGAGQGTSWGLAYPEYLTGSGSWGVAEVLEAPGFDGLITPHDYHARGVGGVYEPEGIADSVALRGRLFYAEMDTRTYANPTNEIGLARDDREYAAITWRNLATGWTRGWNSYWMEFGGGWFDTPGIQELFDRQVAAIGESLTWAHQTVPGIAMVIDDRAVLETNGAGNYLNEAITWEWKLGLARCGVPFRIYLLDDLEREDFPPHRVFYFPNLFRADQARWERVADKVLADGRVVVWGPGSGITDGAAVGAESARRLTGFGFEVIAANAARRVLLSRFDHPITAGLPADSQYGGPLAYGPVLLPRDCTELGLAWTKGGFNHVGLGLREAGRGAAGSPVPGGRGPGDYAALFTAACGLPASLWRGIARYAGAHVYCESNDILLADTSIVALHSLQGGPKSIALPHAHRVWDIIANREHAPGTSLIEFDLVPPETRVFRLNALSAEPGPRAEAAAAAGPRRGRDRARASGQRRR